MNIKFRLWHKKRNIMYYDYFVIYPDGNVEFPKGGWDCPGEIEDPNDYVLMCFSGFKDKNGKEIFEGDILLYKNYISFDGKNPLKIYVVVGFDEGEFIDKISSENLKKKIKNLDYNSPYYHQEKYTDFEIIGNIYENPEILKNVN